MNISELLTKYFNGDTSKEEEFILKRYFTSSDIEPRFLPYKSIFHTLQLERQIANPHTSNSFMGDIEKKEKEKEKSNHTRWWLAASGIAASIFLFIAINLANPQEPAAYVIKNGVKINDPDLALQLYAEKLEKAQELINKGNIHLDEARKTTERIETICEQAEKKVMRYETITNKNQ